MSLYSFISPEKENTKDAFVASCRLSPAPLTPDQVWKRIAPRRPDAHKGTCGKVLAVCGCAPYRGAAALCTLGALYSGAGLVTLAAPEIVLSSIAGRILEATLLPLPDDDTLIDELERATVCAAGCGKKADEDTRREMRLVLAHATGTIVLDAGGLCSLAQLPNEPDVPAPCGAFSPTPSSPTPSSPTPSPAAAASCAEQLSSCAGRLILTPHPGEMARLTGLPTAQILQMPADIAAGYAKKTGAVVVLKGHRTLIAAPDGTLFENRTGNAGLARGGSGDLLTGIIAGLAAQELSPLDAALCGVWLHGSAADRCARRKSVMGMLPEDILEDLSRIFLENGR